MRLLCSPPTHLDLSHLLNDWMEWDEEVDRGRAADQWAALVATLREAGATVEVLSPDPAVPAMTFTRDLGVTVEGRVLTLTNLGPRGRGEPRRVRRWLREADVPHEAWRRRDRLEGGNVLRTGWGWLVGVRAGMDADPTRRLAAELRARTGDRAAVLPLAEPAFGHLDMTLADLGPCWLAHPPGLVAADFGAGHWPEILGGRPVIEVEADEARRLAVNVAQVGDVVIGDLSARLCRRIEAHGLLAAPVDLDEFRKAGGGAHCCTLELPPSAPVEPPRPPALGAART